MATYYYVYPFGENADDLTSIPTPAAGDGSVSYFAGWTDPYEYNLLTNPAALPIPRGQMNQLFYDITNNIQQYQQVGTPAFITAAQNLSTAYPYGKYSRVLYTDGNIYESQVSSNVSTPGASDTWLLASAAQNGVPVGTIIDFAGTSAPSNYLSCDGTAISRTTYAGLFAAIGTTWGVGDGSTTFNLPNAHRSVTVGAGGTTESWLANTVGASGGTETFTIVQANFPASMTGTSISGTSIGVTSGGSSTIFGVGPPVAGGGVQTNTDIWLAGASTPIVNYPPAIVTLKCIRAF